MKKIITIIAAAILMLIGGCTSQPEQNTQQSESLPVVYTSFYAMYDFAKAICGDKAEIVCMVPAGVEPHEWEPSPSDISGLEKADLFAFSGGHMEHWTESVLPTLSNKSLKTVSMQDDHNRDYEDPHWWLSPSMAEQYAVQIKNAMTEIDPSNSDYYEKNCKEFGEKARELSKKIEEASAGFRGKEVIVAHEAFGYLCKICGIKQLALEGLAGESDPSPAKMAELANVIKEKNIRYIFTEPGGSTKAIDTLANETGVQTLELNPFEFDEDGKDYFTVMEENLAALVRALS